MQARVVALLKYSLLLAPLALLPMASCNGGGGGGGGGGNALSNAMIACGLLTPGMFNSAAASTDPFDVCMVQCMAGGTCAELEGLFCSFDDALIERCYAECLQTNGHMCDGMLLEPYLKCDGFQDCTDGSDEVGCPPPFMCGDGSQIPPDWQCDGEADCQDASDEAGCPAGSTFTCGSGEQLPGSYQCDFEQDCADGSDEAGCAMLTCPDNGTTTLDTLSTTSPGTFTTSDTGALDTGTTG